MGSLKHALRLTAILALAVSTARAQDHAPTFPGLPGRGAAPATPAAPAGNTERYRTQLAGAERGATYSTTVSDYVLVGFRISYGTSDGQQVIQGLVPLFQDSNGRIIPGGAFGTTTTINETVQAKDGYAVGGMLVQPGDSILGFAVNFDRIKKMPDGSVALEMTDGYRSSWFGSQGGRRQQPVQLHGHGNPVVGVYGSFLANLSSIGLVCRGVAPADGLPDQAPKPDPAIAPAVAGAPALAPAPNAADSHISAEFLQQYRDGLVFVDGDNGKGSGFICNLQNHKLLVTNAHVLAGVHAPSFHLLDRSPIKVSQAAVAVGHDIAVLAVTDGGKAIDAMESVDTNIAIGDPIVVLGNSEGAGVIKPLDGKIVGLGPNLVEVDAEFVPGNSGSPIIHKASGKVIGVATYLLRRQFESDGSRAVKTEVRRFGYRLDSVKKWEPIVWQSFYAQAAQIEKVQGLSSDLVHLLQDLDSGKFNPERHQNPVIKNRIDSWIEVRKRRGVSKRDVETADANLFSFLKVACETDVTQVRRQLTYDYFIRQLDEEQKDRDELAKVFGKVAALVR